MPRRETHHEAVRSALVAEGWSITSDPLRLQYGGVELYVDLGAERLLAAERGNECTAVEVKSFVGQSDIAESYGALGQYLSYRQVLAHEDPARTRFLAVPEDMWTGFFTLPFAREMLDQHRVCLIVCDMEREEIRQWTRS